MAASSSSENDDALGMQVVIKLADHLQTGFGRGGTDQIDDYLIADQRLGAPIHGDERKQPARSGRS